MLVVYYSLSASDRGAYRHHVNLESHESNVTHGRILESTPYQLDIRDINEPILVFANISTLTYYIIIKPIM